MLQLRYAPSQSGASASRRSSGTEWDSTLPYRLFVAVEVTQGHLLDGFLTEYRF
ncbi:hypothetical protein PSCT_02789 [Pseudomonas sp. SCT]|jgi:hypothetical protein|uniref:Uncharacterized protein n=1 Tax=Stutzerimonas stutzeri RCH2 TaxID=644801 RepID=L0GPZ8_STUST|nr:hypothetical protein Psest_2952 [Stutzerimonas stutzeri RCH2]GCA56582.1 hypothetical protein PSCT_02789 [Pseudomonas sp. SCT]